MSQPPGKKAQRQQHKEYQGEQECHDALQQRLLAPEQCHNARWKGAENQRTEASPLYQEQRLGEVAAPAESGWHLRVNVESGCGPVRLLPSPYSKIVFFSFQTSLSSMLFSKFLLNEFHELQAEKSSVSPSTFISPVLKRYFFLRLIS